MALPALVAQMPLICAILLTFYTLPHIVLIHRLKLLGIPTPLLHWLFSSTHERFQRIVDEGTFSSCVIVFFWCAPGISFRSFAASPLTVSLNYALQWF